MSDPCYPMDYSLPGSSVQGILQARTLEWVDMLFSRASFLPSDQTHVSLHLLHLQANSLSLAPPGKPCIPCSNPCNKSFTAPNPDISVWLWSALGTWMSLLAIDKAAAAKSLQSCPTLCDPIDSSPPGCPVPGILQARTLEWVAISFSNAWKWKVKVKSLGRVRLLATPWTAAYQAPPWDFPGKSTGVGCHCLLLW